MLRRLYEQAIEAVGYQVTTCADAQEAIHACETRTPDCIVMELQLKLHGGFEFIYELRTYVDWQNIPIILHTFVPPRELQSRQGSLNKLGVVNMCYKPETSMQKLLQVIEDVTLVS